MTSLTTSGDVHAVVATELLDDRYQLVALLHRSDDTETWHAHDARLDRDVVVELLPPVGRLQELLSQKYSGPASVYDAGSYTWRGDPCTYVVTTSEQLARPGTYRPRHSHRESATRDAAPAPAPTPVGASRPGGADDAQPLSVGNWEVVNSGRRPARSWRTRKASR